MKILSRDNPARPLIIVCLSYAVVCYALFFTACLLPIPSWGPALMAWFAPVIKAIQTAAQVGALKGHDPFPIQVVILYSSLGTIPVTIYCVGFCLFNSSNRKKWLENMVRKAKEKTSPRLKLFFSGLIVFAAGTVTPHGMFFYELANFDSWNTIRGNSLTLYAVFLYLGASFMPFLGIVLGGTALYLSLTNRFKQPQ